MKIERILASRTDLSSFLVHLTRTTGGEQAKDRLKGILRDGKIKAMNPFGPAVGALREAGKALESQHAVCFTETPLQHVSLLTHRIEKRAIRFSSYGIAITKRQARALGVNPVWYLDITPGHDWLTKPLNKLIAAAIKQERFPDGNVAKLVPFIEQMGSGDRYKKEFWWEREWRKVGDFGLPSRFIVLCPEVHHETFRKILKKAGHGEQSVVDPHWGLEEIIARLAGFSAKDVQQV